MSLSQKVLIAEKSITIQKAIHIALKNASFEIKSVSSFEDLEKLAHAWHPNFILLDTKILKNSCQSSCEGLRKNLQVSSRKCEALSGIKIVLLHSPLEDLDAKNIHMLGADEALMKPFDAESLLKKLVPLNVIPEAQSAIRDPEPLDSCLHIEPQIEKLAKEIVEKITWEVVPRLSEQMIREELNKLLKKPS
ncbi:MAG: response regulator [Deltaproteobacteria bacterium]|nr:response regulator [Deltaproteobacteria bacterium]